MNAKLNRRISEIRSAAPQAESLLGYIAVSATIMDRSQRVIAVNKFAVDLTGFSVEDFAREPSLWTTRIFPADQADYSKLQEQMNRGDAQVSGEYRFFGNGATVPIWLRQISVPLAGLDSPMWLSTYLTIAERERPQPPRPDSHAGAGRDLMERCFHEIKNRLHLLSMELELAELDSADSFDRTKMTDALSAINDSLKILQQHLLAPRR